MYTKQMLQLLMMMSAQSRRERNVDIREYHRILKKESKLSRRERDEVVADVEWAISKGKLFRNEDGTVTYGIKV